MKNILPDNNTVCDLCHHQFQVSRDTLKEENVTLEKDSLSHDVVLTYLRCPNCGKDTPSSWMTQTRCRFSASSRSVWCGA